MSLDSLKETVAQLGAKTALERERAAERLRKTLLEADTLECFEQAISRQDASLASDEWETRLGALTALKVAVSILKRPDWARTAVGAALSVLSDPEVRVRIAAGECLGEAAAILGSEAWTSCRIDVLDSIDRCWDRDVLLTSSVESSGLEDSQSPRPDFVSDLLQSSYHRIAPGTGEMRHGTEGWQALETSFLAVRRVVEGCQSHAKCTFRPHISSELLQLLQRACRHPNRFVRETSYHTLASLCEAGGLEGPAEFGNELASVLQDGLSENWSQVRYAACMCARAFLVAAGRSAEAYFPAILPHLCFNRYDVAEGVRFYSLATWKLILKGEGPVQVARHIDQVVDYYVRCAKTNNHTVREAACNCIAELFAKIEAEAVKPHLPKLQRTLFRGLKDDSWTVRDAAATAYAKAVLAFPDECRAAIPGIWPLWLGLLDDNVFSVRQHAAAALADVARAYGDEVIGDLVLLIRTRLQKAHEQPASRDEGSSFSVDSGSNGSATTSGLHSQSRQTNGRHNGVAEAPLSGGAEKPGGISPAGELEQDAENRAGDASVPPAHPDPLSADVELFKEESLLRARPKDTGGIDYSCGCMDYGFKREKQPWEAADGAVYLLTELADVAPGAVPSLLPVLAEVSLLGHWPQARSLQTTICRQLPELMDNLGKKVFKPYIELFLPTLFCCLACENQLCRAAAGRCLGHFRDSLGPRIFAGRLDELQSAAMAASLDVPSPAGRFK